MKSTKKTVDVYEKKCPVCNLIIKGNSKSQVMYNLNYHQERKHEVKK